MSVKVLFFASLADITGTRETSVEGKDFPNVNAIFNKFAEDFPALEAYRTSVLFALNSEFARPGATVRDGDELAIFPPVSGG